MKNFTSLFIAVLLALGTAGLVLYYSSLPFGHNTVSDLMLVRSLMARYTGILAALYLALVGVMVIPSAASAAAVAIAATGGRAALRLAVRALLISLLLVIVGALLGHVSWRLCERLSQNAVVHCRDSGHAISAPLPTLKSIVRRRVLSFTDGSCLRSVLQGGDGFLAALFAVLVAIGLSATRPRSPLRQLMTDLDEAVTGVFKTLTFYVAPVAIFFCVFSWLLVVWPVSFAWYYVAQGLGLAAAMLLLVVLCLAMASRNDYSPNIMLRSLRLPFVTGFGLGSSYLAFPQTIEAVEECLGFHPLPRGIAVPVASLVARAGTAMVLAFAASAVSAAFGATGAAASIVIICGAVVLSFTATETTSGLTVLVLALCTASTAGAGKTQLFSTGVAVCSMAVLSLRLAAVVDIVAAVSVGAFLSKGGPPEGLDPDMSDDELLSLARKRRRRILGYHHRRGGAGSHSSQHRGGRRSGGARRYRPSKKSQSSRTERDRD